MERYSQLDTVIEEIMSRWDIPGMGIGIVQDGEIVYVRGFGVQSLATGVPVNVDSIFGVASISKCFVASAIMQLVEQGKIKLNMPLVEYLPDFQMNDERYRQITIRQILSHTSGMPDMDEAEYDQLVYRPEYDEGALERYVHALASRKMIAVPGERRAQQYCLHVLSYLLARISGKSFEEHMRNISCCLLGCLTAPSSFQKYQLTDWQCPTCHRP
jgi:CubicO group peptidase (beta-lactamase class C family)